MGVNQTWNGGRVAVVVGTNESMGGARTVWHGRVGYSGEPIECRRVNIGHVRGSM